LASVLAIALLAVIGATSASAELAQRGNLFVHFDGGISPRALPREALAPIGVRIEGTIRVPPGPDPPSLRQIRIAVNQAGRLNATGLPVCQRHQIEATSDSEALSSCGTALVGAGGIVARTTLPDQPASTVRGQILLFNSVENGRPAILAHFFQTSPTPVTRIVVFEIRRNGSPFGTVITGKVPPQINRNGYLKSIFLQLERRYTFHGRPRSYLSAACSAPAGFTSAAFPFAHASMTFDDGRALSSTLVRSCKVK
jgi:hypothetical protein